MFIYFLETVIVENMYFLFENLLQGNHFENYIDYFDIYSLMLGHFLLLC